MENESLEIEMDIESSKKEKKNEPSNFCNKIPKNIIGLLGIVFSLGLVAFFGFVFMILEVKLIFALLIFCKFQVFLKAVFSAVFSFSENLCFYLKFKKKL